MTGEPAAAVDHPCLGSCRRSLDSARLRDQQRLAVVLQGAALLAHLRHAGWCLPGGFESAGLGSGATLRVGGARPGSTAEMAQQQLGALLAAAFGETDGVAGRGAARRAARALLDRWGQSLAPVHPDAALAQLFDAAPFLWKPAFGDARKALVAQLVRGEKAELWVAGPAEFRRRVLALAEDRAAAEALLEGPRAAELWRLAAAGSSGGRAGGDPGTGGRTRGETTEGKAERLFAEGRFESALAALKGVRGADARIRRAACQVYLGRLGAALKTLGGLDGAAISPAQQVAAAEMACRALFQQGDVAGQKDWVARALAAGRKGRGEVPLRAALVAATAAVDQQDPRALARHLARAEGAREHPRLGWRWAKVAALAAMDGARGEEVVEHLGPALRSHRRGLRRFEAGGLWVDLGVGRAQTGDLAGAERAFLHAQRLLGTCEGPRHTTLALHNLAEIRLRRGRLLGVRRILERSTAENRQSGNLRGKVQDLELWARYEMLLGRFEAALAHLTEALELLESGGLGWRRPVIHTLAARALGWSGRAAEAAEQLALSTPEARAELEGEERPALWAHAGLRDEALRESAGALAELWHALLTGREATEPQWRRLEELEPYRRARFVFDAEVLAPGSVPGRWLRRAAGTLRALGAVFAAQRLEARDSSPWQALACYAAAEPGEHGALARLFSEAGYPEARLAWYPGGDGPAVEIVAGTASADGGGSGGDAETRDGAALRAPLPNGVLELTAAREEGAQEHGLPRALLALAARDFRPPPERPSARRSSPRILGESPQLRAALERLARLAPADLPVLVLGESGTGKELVAEEVHRLSRRASGPLVPLNCAALSETLVLSDLFGHVRGAFTGADKDRAGVFEMALGGTAFLDEIGDLPLAAQGMLLRLLQEGEVRRLGESLPRKVEVRVVAATHRDLEAMVREGTFREDLYFRLKVARVVLPPLRDRGRDVLLLAEHFLSRGRQLPVPRLSNESRDRLLAYRWVGNVRELENVLNVAAALAADGVILPEHLDLPDGEQTFKATYHRETDEHRKRLVEEALAAAGWNRSQAARRLGLTRQALSYLIKKFKLEP